MAESSQQHQQQQHPQAPEFPTDQEIEAKLQEYVKKGERDLARVWQYLLFEGLIAIAFGIMLIVWPGIGLGTMVWLVGLYLIVRGVLRFSGAFMAPQAQNERRWLVADGVISFGLGIAVLVWPDISSKALLYVIAAWALATGLLIMSSTVYLPVSGGRKVLNFVSGLVFVCFGAVMFIEPGTGAYAEIALVAALFIVAGTMLVAFSYELRKLVHGAESKLTSRPTPKATTKPATH
jgi:uncharacterized membrane protein HdeD (DUF308 family)